MTRVLLLASLAASGCAYVPVDPDEDEVDLGEGCLRPWLAVELGFYPVSLDIDGDGHLDVASLVEDGVAWGMNLDPNSGQVGRSELADVDELQAGELDDDEHGDLVVRIADGKLFALHGTGHGLGAPKALGVDDAVPGYRLGDVNRDGRDDLVEPSPLVRYRLQNDDGSFADPVEIQSQAGDLAVGDFDQDHVDDVLVARGNHVSVFWGDEKSPLVDREDLLYPGEQIDRLEVRDLNADGHPDLVQSSNDGDVGFVYGRGIGDFTERVDPLGEDGSDFVLADMDGDGILDFVSVDGDGQVRYGELDEDERLGFGERFVFDEDLSLVALAHLARGGRSYRLEDWTGDGRADVVGIVGLMLDDGGVSSNEGESFTVLMSCSDAVHHRPN